MGKDQDVCPLSERVDGKLHSWKFDGDDPYVVCVYCGQMRDALTENILKDPQPKGENE